jgi:hypothetical protein
MHKTHKDGSFCGCFWVSSQGQINAIRLNLLFWAVHGKWRDELILVLHAGSMWPLFYINFKSNGIGFIKNKAYCEIHVHWIETCGTHLNTFYIIYLQYVQYGMRMRGSVQCDQSWIFYYYSIFESFTCFGPLGPSSEGAWESTNVPRSTSHNRASSPCFAVVHVGIGYIN